ncbi:hypothetical protein DFP93_11566 [Aneurinibacillus soli]|uniref:Uncharacterized protein n=1 Tax=Aneurinibacillus soli TaxID=1500254 RepID=A0A0U5B021_9BACL|nr:YcdB/YcdC domain-containing protein [Aneurinibacillus soli]PYE59908.1 hypothetical protein DFP93_11566 [Aneurinibacillus soli]BAU29370.1 hypothetical protein CB4_03570 [Aneurinibacillus soli]
MKKPMFMLSAILASNLLLIPAVLAEVREPSASMETEHVLSIQELPKPVKDSLDKLYVYKPELKGLPIKITQTKDPVSSINQYSLDFKNDPNMIHAIIGQDGTLHYFQISKPGEKSERRPSDEEATKKAKEFLTAIHGSNNNYIVSHVTNGGYTTTDRDGKESVTAYASVTFIPLINGIPYKSSFFLQIDVNQAGEVVNYFNHNDPINPKDFPIAKNVLSKEDAEKAFLQSLTMNLYYEDEETVRGTTDPKNIRTILKYQHQMKPIDAVSGKPVEENVYTQHTISKPVTGQGKVLRASNAKEAAALLKSELGIQVDGLTYREDGDGIKQAKLYEWTTKDNLVYAVQTTDKGEVIRFGALSVHNPDKMKGEEKIPRDKAAAQALDKIKKYLPTYAKEVQVDYTEENYPHWVDKNNIPKNNILLVSFRELHDNIPIMTRSIDVWVNLGTGAVEQVSLPPLINSELPDASKRITKEEAVKSYLDHHPLQLQYVWPHYFDQKAEKPILVYAPQTESFVEYVDALTGKIVRPYE